MEPIQINVSVELNLSQDVKNFLASVVSNHVATPAAPAPVPAPAAPAAPAAKPAPAPQPALPICTRCSSGNYRTGSPGFSC